MKHITSTLFIALASYTALYGVTYAYLLHHLTSIVVTWLVGIHFFAGGFSLRSFHPTVRTPDIEKDEFRHADGQVKKLP